MFRFFYSFDQRLVTKMLEKDCLLMHNKLQELTWKKAPKISDFLATTAETELSFKHEQVEY